jgi:very-short-patch-repair endonuclease
MKRREIPLLRWGAAEGGGVVGAARDTAAYHSLPYNPALKERARELRKAGNLSEALLWLRLKSGQLYGLDFDRQKIIGNYIVDFYCVNNGLVIEIDGDSHAGKEEYDAERDRYLEGLGLNVLHVSDMDVKQNLEGVLERIMNKAAEIPLLRRGAAGGGGVVATPASPQAPGAANVLNTTTPALRATPPWEGNR